MRWRWRLGKLAGIVVYMHVTFLLLLGWVGLSQLLAGRGVAEALGGVLFILLLFACVLAHEYGHALTARRYGIQTVDITLLPIGGVARLERMPRDPVQELLVALAGPAVNVVIAGALFIFLRNIGQGMAFLFGFLGLPPLGGLDRDARGRSRASGCAARGDLPAHAERRPARRSGGRGGPSSGAPHVGQHRRIPDGPFGAGCDRRGGARGRADVMSGLGRATKRVA